MMTELQKIEIEILKQFLHICERENLQYYLVCGSALGAVKYNGFIPWDDDIDVALPRKDYEKFLLVADKYLPDWIFLQNYKTDSEYPCLGTKLRDSRTTYIEKMCGKLNINHGVFIDVFPLDCHWSLHSKRLKFKFLHMKFEAKRRVHLEYNRFSRHAIFQFVTNLYYLANRLFGLYGDTSACIREFDCYLMANGAEDNYWCNYANSPSSREYSHKRQFGNGVQWEFEGLKVIIPENYDEYLTQKYGDWRADLPIEQQKGHHYFEICDLKKSFTEYRC